MRRQGHREETGLPRTVEMESALDEAAELPPVWLTFGSSSRQTGEMRNAVLPSSLAVWSLSVSNRNGQDKVT